MANPFFHGNPVSVEKFVGRGREARRIAGRILHEGQSTALVGEPRLGKTSLLLYLSRPEKRQTLYGAPGEHLVFSYIDAQTLGDGFNQAQFWDSALNPFYEGVIAPDRKSVLREPYVVCKENGFGALLLERLLALVREAGWQLVLCLDEFDRLLYHPILHSVEFFGGLRSLASRSRGALTLVIASRRPLATLNQETQDLGRTGSPFFNFLDEVVLGPLSPKEAADLLGRAGDRFLLADRRYISYMAGEHPYLLQVAASAMWEAYEEAQRDPRERYVRVGKHLYSEVARTLGDTWRLWPPATRKAFTLAALADITRVLGKRRFHVSPLLRDARDLEPELAELEKQGFVRRDDSVQGNWRVRAQAFAWWLADELVRTARDTEAWEEWIRRQAMDGLLTKGEKQALGSIARTVGGLLKQGAETFVEAVAAGWAKGMTPTGA